MIASYLNLAMYTLIGTATALAVKAFFRLSRARSGLAGLRGTALAEALAEAGKELPWLAAIASTAPFAGLAFTLVHVSEALTRAGAHADLAALSAPLAGALWYTLLGILAAVPAAVAHAVLARRLDDLAMIAEAREREGA